MTTRQYTSKEVLARLPVLDLGELRRHWRDLFNAKAPPHLSRELLVRARMQELALGGLRPAPQRRFRQIAQEVKERGPVRRRLDPQLRPGTRMIREWRGRTYEVLVVEGAFCWQDRHYRSLFAVARTITGTAWSGPLFFGLRANRSAEPRSKKISDPAGEPQQVGDAAG